ncbi:hypothetical protein pb186bvf_004660 [Paramecium bursaria]
MALLSCKYRFVFVLNLKNDQDKKFNRQNNTKFMEILQIEDLNQNLNKVFLEYQITLVKQRTTILLDGTWTDKRYYINILYYQRLLQFGDSWIKQNKQSLDMKVAIEDFKCESERYIHQKYTDQENAKCIQLDLLQTIIDYLQENNDEEQIMEQLLLFYTYECFFYRMLQEYLRLQDYPFIFVRKGYNRIQIGQYIDKKELYIYQNQQQGSRSIMLSFLSCSTIQIAKQFLIKDIDGLDTIILDFKGFTAFKELMSEFNEIEKCLGPMVEVIQQKQKIIGHHKAFEFKQGKFHFDDEQLGELKRQKQIIMEIFNKSYKNIKLVQAEFSLMYDKDPYFVIDILKNQKFDDFDDEVFRLSKLSRAYRHIGNRDDAIKFGEQSVLLSRQQYGSKDLQLRMEVAWVYLDDQQFSLSFLKYRDCFFSDSNRNFDYRPQILNNIGCIYWNLGQYNKAEKCQETSKKQKESSHDRYDLLSKSISNVNYWHAKFLVIQHQDFPDEIRSKFYLDILDQFFICMNERSIVRDYYHHLDHHILQRISMILFQMGYLKELQDYRDFMDNLITNNNTFYECVALNYYIKAKLLIDQKKDQEADLYFQKAISYLNDHKYAKRIELLRIYSDYEDFCLKLNKSEQANICRKEYLRISSYILKEILRIRELIPEEQEQLILEGKFD